MVFGVSGDTAGQVPAVIPDRIPGAEQEEPEEQPLRIMLLGKSGVGKSSSGNTILGRYVFKSDMKLVRVTAICEKEVGVIKDVPMDATGKVEDVPVAVIDTPGLFETERNKDDIVREILKCVKLHEPGPHAFVLVVPVGRMTQEDDDTNTLIEAKFGPRVWDYTIVLFTHGDRLEGKTINDVITESDVNLRNFIRKCGGGFHVFNNKDVQDQEQVTSFIEKIRTLVALNGGGYYHTDLYPEKERRIRKRQESILAERDADIRRRERELQEHHQDEELVLRKKLLWKKEEDKARLAAEEEAASRNMFRSVLFLGGLLGLLAGWALWVPDPWLLVGIVIWILIFFKDFLSLLGKICTLSQKK